MLRPQRSRTDHLKLMKLLEISFDKDTTYQGRGMGIRKTVKKRKIRVKIIKQKT